MLDASNIIFLPLAFVRSGGVSTVTNNAGSIGYDCWDWSQTAYSNTYAYRLNSISTYVGPSTTYHRRDTKQSAAASLLFPARPLVISIQICRIKSPISTVRTTPSPNTPHPAHPA